MSRVLQGPSFLVNLKLKSRNQSGKEKAESLTGVSCLCHTGLSKRGSSQVGGLALPLCSWQCVYSRQKPLK